MITYSDLNQDPFQLRNMLYTLSGIIVIKMKDSIENQFLRF